MNRISQTPPKLLFIFTIKYIIYNNFMSLKQYKSENQLEYLTLIQILEVMVTTRKTRLTLSNLKTPSQIHELLLKKRQFQTYWAQDQVIRFYKTISAFTNGKGSKKKKSYEIKQCLDEICAQFRKQKSRDEIQYFALKEAYKIIQNKITKNKRYNGNWFSYVPIKPCGQDISVCEKVKVKEWQDKQNQNSLNILKSKQSKCDECIIMQPLNECQTLQIMQLRQKTHEKKSRQKNSTKKLKKRHMKENLERTIQMQEGIERKQDANVNPEQKPITEQNIQVKQSAPQKYHKEKQLMSQTDQRKQQMQDNAKRMLNIFEQLQKVKTMPQEQMIDEYYFYPSNFDNERSKRIYEQTLFILGRVEDPVSAQQECFKYE